MTHYSNILSEFKGLLWLAVLPGLVAVAHIALAAAETARDRRQGGGDKKKKGKDNERPD